MPALSDCLHLIAAAKAAAAHPESAYAQRARLKRALLATGQFVAAQVGVREPVMPNDVSRVRPVDASSAEALGICVSLLAKARRLCQPSEALDSRWRSGCAEVEVELNSLERALHALQLDR